MVDATACCQLVLSTLCLTWFPLSPQPLITPHRHHTAAQALHTAEGPPEPTPADRQSDREADVWEGRRWVDGV